MADKDDSNGIPDMTNKEMLRLLLQEISYVRTELQQEISSVKKELKEDIVNLTKKIDQVDRKVDDLSFKVDRNHLTFMKNLDDVDKRVGVLEAVMV